MVLIRKGLYKSTFVLEIRSTNSHNLCKLGKEFYNMADKNAHHEKLSLLSQLVKLARADKEVKESEFQFLWSIAKQLEISEDEFKRVFEQYIGFEPPEMEMDRIVQFHRLVLLMNIDQEIDDEELVQIKNLGMRMGLHPLAIAEVLDTLHQYPNNMMPPDKLISIFRAFHN
jgi:hypothetical protein